MKKKIIFCFGFFMCFLIIFQCTPKAPQATTSQINSPQNLADFLTFDLGYLYQNLDTSKGNSWQAVHKEKKQDFYAYINSNPTSTTPQRNKIYLQTFGEFSNKEKKIIEITAEYLAVLYNLEVKILALQNLDSIPDYAHRINQHSQENQILSPYLLNKILLPQLPDSAAVYIGFTSSDLYPSKTWNYVFGQANLRKRTGIWSIYRFGNPNLSQESFNLTLKRTIKTASHEIGHIFSIRHCVAYECTMAGSNNLRDLDKHPVYFCPICTAKICTNLNINLENHYKKLEFFWKKYGFKEQASFYHQHYQIVNSNKLKYQNLQGLLKIDELLNKKE